MCIHKHEPQTAVHRTVIFQNGIKTVLETKLADIRNKNLKEMAESRLMANRNYYRGRKTQLRKQAQGENRNKAMA